jgi:hypothetical protein
MKHLSEEELVEGYYGGLSESAALHLAECAECRALFERQSELLDAVREYPVPERGPGYGAEVWVRMLPRLPRPKQSWWRMWALVPAVAALLALAFLAGRWTERTTAVAGLTGISEKARERVLLLSLSDHLERSQIVLAQLAHRGQPLVASNSGAFGRCQGCRGIGRSRACAAPGGERAGHSHEPGRGASAGKYCGQRALI